MPLTRDEDIAELLTNARTIAVVGASRDPSKSAHGIPAMLRRQGYRVIPVNPHAETLFGEKVHRTLASIAAQQKVYTDLTRQGGALHEAKSAIDRALGGKTLQDYQADRGATVKAAQDLAQGLARVANDTQRIADTTSVAKLQAPPPQPHSGW